MEAVLFLEFQPSKAAVRYVRRRGRSEPDPSNKVSNVFMGWAALTGVGGVVLGVLLQLVYVHLHSGPGRALHHAVDVFPGQGQRQPLATPTHGLVIKDGG